MVTDNNQYAMLYDSEERPPATATQIASLKKAFSYDRPPLCSGTVSPPPEGLYLYYGNENSR